MTSAETSNETDDPEYRPTVGICLVKNNEVFLAKRRKHPHAGWQMPQGGVDAGEDVKAAAFRELFEETGVKREKVEVLAEHPEWLCLEFPDFVRAQIATRWPSCKGQMQRWFLMRFLGEDSDINIDGPHAAEFIEWKWGSLHMMADEVIPFKKHLYQQVAAAFNPYISTMAH